MEVGIIGMHTMPLSQFESLYINSVKFPYCDLLRDHVTIAGGAIRDWIAGVEHKGDIDIFHDGIICHSDITNFNGMVVHRIDNFAGDNECLLRSFDFTINQCAVFMDNGVPTIMFGDYTISDIVHRILRYCSDGTGTHPVFHIRRIGKFIEMGYDIEPDQIITICEKVIDRKDDPIVDYCEDGDL